MGVVVMVEEVTVAEDRLVMVSQGAMAEVMLAKAVIQAHTPLSKATKGAVVTVGMVGSKAAVEGTAATEHISHSILRRSFLPCSIIPFANSFTSCAFHDVTPYMPTPFFPLVPFVYKSVALISTTVSTTCTMADSRPQFIFFFSCSTSNSLRKCKAQLVLLPFPLRVLRTSL